MASGFRKRKTDSELFKPGTTISTTFDLTPKDPLGSANGGAGSSVLFLSIGTCGGSASGATNGISFSGTGGSPGS